MNSFGRHSLNASVGICCAVAEQRAKLGEQTSSFMKVFQDEVRAHAGNFALSSKFVYNGFRFTMRSCTGWFIEVCKVAAEEG